MKNTAWGLSENSSYKIVALLITLILWIIILGSKEDTMVMKIAVDYNVPKDMKLVGSVPNEVVFWISGSRLGLKKYNEHPETLSVDLTAEPEGLIVKRFDKDGLNLPTGLRVTSLSPTTIRGRLEKLMRKTVPIKVRTAGDLADGKKLVSAVAKPDHAELLGPRSIIEKTEYIETAPIDLNTIGKESKKEVPLQAADSIDKVSPSKTQVELVTK